MTLIYSFVVGALSWTLCEYLLHRFIGHSKKSQRGFAQEHRAHHSAGDYFMPLLKKLRVSLQVLAPLTLVSIYLLGSAAGSGFALGFTVFFLIYEIVHKRAHTHPPQNSYGRWLRRHHFFHHFSAPRKNFGVTTPLWDWVFRTYTPAGLIRLPAKKAMVWLIDPQTDEVLPQFASDYQIRSVKNYRNKAS